jgi:hypothetical protein
MNRKRSLSSKLSRHDPTDDELDASLAEFRSAHDRVAAIMGAALLENTLLGAIKICLDDDSDVGALFHDERAPFGTLMARIVAAKAFKLITPKLAEDLNTIRDIRNQFAHALLSIDFENEHVAAECEKLKHYPDVEEGPKKRAPISAPRKYYENACYTLTIHLLRKGTERQESQIKDAERKIQELTQPQNALTNYLEHLRGLGDLVTASLKNSADNIPDDSGADKL